MRLLIVLVLAMMLTVSVAKAPEAESVVSIASITFDRDQPAERRFGKLDLLGAWKLTSDIRGFGGISSMMIANGRITGLNDRATLWRFPVPDRDGSYPLRQRQLPNIFRPNIVPDSDSESMTSDPSTGRIWVGFEDSNSIRPYSRGFGRQLNWVGPPAMIRWPDNAGPEAMVRLKDGRFIVFSEEAEGSRGAHEALLFQGDPTYYWKDPVRFYYRPPPGFNATDAALLPDGRILLLNRHFSVFDGVAATLTIIDPKKIAPGAILEGALIARLAPPLTIDNMEALAIEKGEGEQAGKIIAWIMSDDNFNPLQQTLLMKFAFDPREIE